MGEITHVMQLADWGLSSMRLPRRPPSVAAMNTKIANPSCTLPSALLLAILVMAGSATARADAVTDWAAILEESTLHVPDPAQPIRVAAITQLAVFEAVNSIVGDYEPYLAEPYLEHVAPAAAASPEAAAIAAAHRVLVVLLPDQAESLNARRATSLATLPDGAPKRAGIAIGEAAADAILARRAHDGMETSVPYTPGTLPGQYRPTPPDFTPAFGAHLARVTPFAIRSAARYRVPPPPALRSHRYARDYSEVKKVGDFKSMERPQDRADVARFYAPDDIVPIYFSAARQVSLAQGKTLAENARIFALLGMAIFDAMVACFDSKYFHDYWRPLTAIRLGHTDGNRQTEADPAWTPFVFTPPFPSYPSGHASFGGAARHVLERVYGKDGHTITLSTPEVPEVVLHYSSWKQVTDDIDDARIYGGVHFRFDQEEAARQGHRIGRYILRHWLRPLSWRAVKQDDFPRDTVPSGE
jgi:hypothetical protein